MGVPKRLTEMQQRFAELVVFGRDRMLKPTCCKQPHLGAEVEGCGCEITLCFTCGDERLVQPCTKCSEEIQRV